MELKDLPLKENYPVNIGSWLERGWEMFTRDIGQYIAMTAIYLVILSAASSTTIFVLIILGPLNAGFFYVIMQRERKNVFKIVDIGRGFNYFIPSLLISIVKNTFVVIGFAFCIFPSVIIASWYFFPYLFIIDKNMDFWDAMEASRIIAFRHFFEFVLFALVIAAIQTIGLMLCGIGLLVTIPFVNCAIYAAYDSIVKSVQLENAG